MSITSNTTPKSNRRHGFTVTDPIIRAHGQWLTRRNLTPNSIKQRKDQLTRVHRHLGKPLLSASADELDEWQRSLTVCASSVATYSSHVRAFYEWAVDTGHLAENPARDLVMPKIRQRVPRPISEAGLRVAITAAAHEPQLLAWFLLAGFCGLRAGEIAKVCRTDFRDDPSGGALLVVHGKGEHQRIARVPAEVMAELAQFMHRTGPIFRRPGGTPFTPNNISQYSSAFLRSLGLTWTLHTFRHRFATRLCDVGADVRDVQQLLGHRSLATTTLYLAHDARRSSASVDKLSAGLRVMTRRQPSRM